MTQTAITVHNDQKNQASAFRLWVHYRWIENCDERLTVGQKPNTLKKYWSNYKWWLRFEFQQTQSQNTL